jgi:type IV secretory pathway TrbF-like protein
MERTDGNGEFTMPADLQAEIARLEAAYATIQRRDGTAERRAWHWQMTALLAIVGLIGLGVWDHLDKRTVSQAFVQTVVQQEDGSLVSMGVPKDLLDYEPQEGIWLEMVSEWIRRHRWRGKDMVLARGDLAWVQYHTCGPEARRVLSDEQQWFKPEKPEAFGQTLVMVELKSVTKTPSPLSYQVLWKETSVPKHLPPEEKTYTATLTTGRIYPSSQEMLMQNRLGLCVTAYDISPQP